MRLSACVGVRFLEPVVKVIEPDGTEWTYGEVAPRCAETIAEQRLVHGTPVTEWTFEEGDHAKTFDSFTNKQVRIVMRNCGEINPEEIDEYLACDGYKAIDEISESGLRGRGGASFTTGRKWQFAHDASRDTKLIICAADEGDPDAIMNRTVLEIDPHSVLKGPMIGGYAIGAQKGFIYSRAEYPLALKRLRIGIARPESVVAWERISSAPTSHLTLRFVRALERLSAARRQR